MSKIDPTKNRLCVVGESDPFIGRLLERFAEKSGFKVKLARTGDDVVEMTQQNLPGLVILDPELPGKTRGWEAARALKGSPTTCPTAIIICSWLKKTEIPALVGPGFASLQKPDLRYEDFAAALNESGFKIAPGKTQK